MTTLRDRLVNIGATNGEFLTDHEDFGPVAAVDLAKRPGPQLSFTQGARWAGHMGNVG